MVSTAAEKSLPVRNFAIARPSSCVSPAACTVITPSNIALTMNSDETLASSACDGIRSRAGPS
jgi:hypothetical protein